MTIQKAKCCAGLVITTYKYYTSSIHCKVYNTALRKTDILFRALLLVLDVYSLCTRDT